MFKDGIRVILLIKRKKEGGTERDRHQKMAITTSEKEFDDKLAEYLEIAYESKDKLRVYSTVNKRDFHKAVREFKKRQLNYDYVCLDHLIGFYKKLNSQFISCLMKPESKAENIFKFDVDIKDHLNILSFMEDLEKETKILSTNKTKNGWHIFTEPFNHTLINLKKYQAEFQKDSLVLWYW